MIENSISNLEEICRNELVGKRIKEVYWLDNAGRLAFGVETNSEHEVHLVFGNIDCDLVSLADSILLATDRDESNEFRSVATNLVGQQITAIDIRKESNLTLWMTFGNHIRLQLDPCQQPEYDLQAPCWQLFCSDGYVIDVGNPFQSWNRIHKSSPFWI